MTGTEEKKCTYSSEKLYNNWFILKYRLIIYKIYSVYIPNSIRKRRFAYMTFVIDGQIILNFKTIAYQQVFHERYNRREILL